MCIIALHNALWICECNHCSLCVGIVLYRESIAVPVTWIHPPASYLPLSQLRRMAEYRMKVREWGGHYINIMMA